MRILLLTVSNMCMFVCVQLFDHIAACLGEFLEAQGLKEQVLPLGFTFSFPCEQKEIDKVSLMSGIKAGLNPRPLEFSV